MSNVFEKPWIAKGPIIGNQEEGALLQVRVYGHRIDDVVPEIARRVNAHDSLVEALRRLVDAVNNASTGFEGDITDLHGEIETRIIDDALTALSKAVGEAQ